MKNSGKRLAESKESCNFATDKHNSITKQKNCSKKNERNDEEIGPMPSGSMTKLIRSL